MLAIQHTENWDVKRAYENTLRVFEDLNNLKRW